MFKIIYQQEKHTEVNFSGFHLHSTDTKSSAAHNFQHLSTLWHNEMFFTCRGWSRSVEQSFLQPGVSLCDPVIADGNINCLLAADQDHQLFAARNAGIQQVSLQQGIMSCMYGYDDTGKL